MLLLDEDGAPGGQIYRGITGMPAGRRTLLGPDFARGETIVDRFERCAASHAFSTTAWGLAQDGSKGFEIGVSRGGVARHIHAREVVAATGAHERPFPLPGWTLPGVMTAGAARSCSRRTPWCRTGAWSSPCSIRPSAETGAEPCRICRASYARPIVDTEINIDLSQLRDVPSGEVEDISLGYTVLRTDDGREIVIANGTMAQQTMIKLIPGGEKPPSS